MSFHIIKFSFCGVDCINNLFLLCCNLTFFCVLINFNLVKNKPIFAKYNIVQFVSVCFLCKVDLLCIIVKVILIYQYIYINFQIFVIFFLILLFQVPLAVVLVFYLLSQLYTSILKSLWKSKVRWEAWAHYFSKYRLS